MRLHAGWQLCQGCLALLLTQLSQDLLMLLLQLVQGPGLGALLLLSSLHLLLVLRCLQPGLPQLLYLHAMPGLHAWR